MQGSAQVPVLHQVESRRALRGGERGELDLAQSLPRFGRNPGQSELAVDGALRVEREAVFAVVQSVLVQRPAESLRARAQLDVVLLAAGEMQQRRRHFDALDQTQVSAQSARDDRRRLRAAALDRLQHRRRGEEVLDHGLALRRRDGHQKVEIADRFATAPQAAGDLRLVDRRMSAQVRGQSLGRRAGHRQEVTFPEALQTGQALQELLLALRAETRQGRDATFAAGALERRRRFNPQLLEEDAQPLRSETRDAQEILDSGGKFGPQLGQQRERPREDDLSDAGDQARTDSAHFAERAGFVEILGIFRHPFDGARAVGVGAAAKGIFAPELEEVGDLTQDRRNLRPMEPWRCRTLSGHARRRTRAGLRRPRPGLLHSRPRRPAARPRDR